MDGKVEPAPYFANNSKIRLLPDSNKSINDSENEKPLYERSKSSFRWVVLFLSAWAMFGSYYCYDNPTALSNQFQGHMYDLSNLEYNFLYSIYSFPNMILPLFGGIFVDRFGAGYCLVFFLGLVTLGQFVFAIACSIPNYPLMLVARFIFGLGGESLCVASSALLGVYFKGKEMAFAMGLNLSLARGGSSLNDVISLAIYRKFNKVPPAIWFGFFLLVACLLMTALMVYLDIRKCKQKEEDGFKVEEARSDEAVRCDDIREFPIQYWLLTLSCLVVYGCVLPWNNIGGSFIKKKYSYSNSKANSRLLIPYAISALLTPFMGFLVDRIGRRVELLCVSAASLATTHYLFAFSQANPLYGLVILGLAYSIYASAIWPAIALVVKEDKLGTAYGLITAVQNCGLGLFPIAVGALTGVDSEGGKPRLKYRYPEIFFFALALFGVIVGLILLPVDYRRGAPLAAVNLNAPLEDEERLLDNDPLTDGSTTKSENNNNVNVNVNGTYGTNNDSLYGEAIVSENQENVSDESN